MTKNDENSILDENGRSTQESDPLTDYEDLRFSIRNGLSMGPSGYPLWRMEREGFPGDRDSRYYVRCVQAGLFLSHICCQRAEYLCEPQPFGEEADRIFAEYDRLRHRLIPYIHSQTFEKARKGLPMMSHLILSWPDEPQSVLVEDQWMFGDALMVAPVLDETDRRTVWFPKGRWYDFHTGEVISGGHLLTVDAPLKKLPIYVREGSILLFGPLAEHAEGTYDECLSLRVYKKESGTSFFRYYDGSEHIIKVQFEGTATQVLIPETLRERLELASVQFIG